MTYPPNSLRYSALSRGWIATAPRRPVLAILAGLSVTFAVVIGGPLEAHAGWTPGPTPQCGETFTGRSGPLPVPCSPPLPQVKNLNAPMIRQDMPLDCEAAALAVALQSMGFGVSQKWVFDHLPQDPRAAVLSGGHPLHWGDPNTAFVGNVDGSETHFTGYGVYEAPIAAVARLAGATAVGHTGWTASQIEDEVRAGNPVVIWVNFNFGFTRTSTWTAWDGVAVHYTTDEHAVTVVGVNMRTHTVTMVDVAAGILRTISQSAFVAAIATFGGMAVAIS